MGFYDTSMGHYTWYLVTRNELSLKGLQLASMCIFKLGPGHILPKSCWSPGKCSQRASSVLSWITGSLILRQTQ
jgi:hypothetical protein